ncbi:MAG: hypothetical protein ABI392_01800 [Candidatus Saccharimonadales bacterium]
MNKLPKWRRQKGFVGLELLLVLSAICLVVGIALYLFSKQPANSPSKSQTTSPAANTAHQTGSSTSPSGIPGGAGGSPTPATGQSTTVITITQAGLQITVPNSLADLTYHLGQSGGQTVVRFSTQAISKAIPACGASQGSGAFDTVIKASGQYSQAYPGQNPNGGLIQQYPSYYLAYQLPTGPCAKNLSQSQQTLLDDQAQAFYSSLGSVKAL